MFLCYLGLVNPTYRDVFTHIFYLVTDFTHWGRNNKAANVYTTFANVFSCRKKHEFRFRFHWIFFKGRMTNIPALVHIMAWRRSSDKPLFEPMVVSLLTRICVTRPQCVKIHCIIPCIPFASKYTRPCIAWITIRRYETIEMWLKPLKMH